MLLMLLAVAVSSCEQEFKTFTNNPCDGSDPNIICPPAEVDPCPDNATAGDLNLTKFVAVGNSLAAGYQAAALYNDGQENSLPRILAKQFECVGGSPVFNQPDIGSENGFNSIFSDVSQGIILGRLVLFDAGGGVLPTPAGTPGLPSPYNTADLPGPFTGDKAALNNFGVPGIVLGQALISATGGPPVANPAFNPYYARFASNPGTSTLLGDAITAQGSFYLFMLGANDVLGYAIGGGEDEGILTEPEAFQDQYNIAIGAILTALPQAQGVATNVPDPTVLPYFNTIPWNAIELDGATAGLLSQAFGGLNAALDGLVGNGLLSADDAAIRKVTYVEGVNPVLINDEDLEDLGPKFDILLGVGAITQDQRNALAPYEQSRPLNEKELVTFPAALILGTLANPADPTSVFGVAVPVGDAFALTENEIGLIHERTEAFNTTISSVIGSTGGRFVLADINSQYIAFATQGYAFSDGVALTPGLEPPTATFSEDGVHPNSRGYAYLANYIIDVINEGFNATIPHADVGDYPSTGLPIQ